jgi:hypothetical protein
LATYLIELECDSDDIPASLMNAQVNSTPYRESFHPEGGTEFEFSAPKTAIYVRKIAHLEREIWSQVEDFGPQPGVFRTELPIFPSLKA